MQTIKTILTVRDTTASPEQLSRLLERIWALHHRNDQLEHELMFLRFALLIAGLILTYLALS